MADEQKASTKAPSDLERKVLAEIEMRDALFKAYQESVIHQPTTLDEFYYQFALDGKSIEDRNKRNKDQVVTRYLRQEAVENEICWPLLRVSQLWIWIIDESTFPYTL